MNIFIASSIKNKGEVNTIYQKLIDAGHKIVVDWTKDEPVERDDKNFFTEKSRRAVRDLDGVLNCEVFIILSEPIDGRAKYSEFGIALASHINNGRPEIFVVGEDTTRSLFFFHPAVKHKKSIEEVISELE